MEGEESDESENLTWDLENEQRDAEERERGGVEIYGRYLGIMLLLLNAIIEVDKTAEHICQKKTYLIHSPHHTTTHFCCDTGRRYTASVSVYAVISRNMNQTSECATCGQDAASSTGKVDTVGRKRS